MRERARVTSRMNEHQCSFAARLPSPTIGRMPPTRHCVRLVLETIGGPTVAGAELVLGVTTTTDACVGNRP